MEKGGNENMSKRTELKCPFCGALQLRVKVCKEVEIECGKCCASLLITKDEDGCCTISARPPESERKPIPASAT